MTVMKSAAFDYVKPASVAGTAGTPGAVMNALNDALAPLDAELTDMPFTPEKVLQALGRA
jgi:carbon-monoxide dehydrogenase large subunit